MTTATGLELAFILASPLVCKLWAWFVTFVHTFITYGHLITTLEEIVSANFYFKFYFGLLVSFRQCLNFLHASPCVLLLT